MGPLALVIFSVIFPQNWADPVYTKFPILPLDESGQGNKARVAYDLWREVSIYFNKTKEDFSLVTWPWYVGIKVL